MSTPIPPSGSGIAAQASTTVTATTGAGGANSGNVSGGSAGTPGSIPAPPPAVVTLLQQVGATITGTLEARSPGQITLATPQGSIRIALPTPLPASIPANATLQVQVTSVGPPLQVVVQQPPAAQGGSPTAPAAGSTAGTLLAAQAGTAASGTTTGAQSAQAAPTLAGTPVTTSLTQGAVLAATVSGASFSPPSTVSAAPTTANLLTGGTGATAPPSAAASSTPAGTSPAAGTQTSAPPANAANPSAPAGAANPSAPAGTTNPSAAAAGPGALPKNAYLPVRILGLQLPTSPAAPLVATSPLSFIGTVTGATVDGQTVVSTPNGSLTLATRTPAPNGTQVLLEVAGRPTLPASGSQALPSGMTPTFEALRQAIDALQIANPSATQNIIQQLIPQPGPQMGLSIVFFLQALRGGALDRWLGQDGVRSLKRAGGSGALEQEFSSLQGKAKDASGADWRLFNMPVLNKGDIEPLRLYLKDQAPENEDDAEREKPGQRFVIEANFTRLGPFQFDGLVRDKNLTLMIRTMAPVEQSMRADMQSLFTTAVEALGLTGTIGYHVVKTFDLVPVGEGLDARTSGVTV